MANLRSAIGRSRPRAAWSRTLGGLILLGALLSVPRLLPGQQPAPKEAPKSTTAAPSAPQPPPPAPKEDPKQDKDKAAPPRTPAELILRTEEVRVRQADLQLALGTPRRFQFTIDPKTPLKDLLPTPPKVRKAAGPALTDDLTLVPEVQFQSPLKKGTSPDALERTARMMAQINHVNAGKTDGFLHALIAERADLAGMPFAMGDACRTQGERTKQFARAVALVRQALGGPQGQALVPVNAAPPPPVNAPAPQPAPAPGPGGPPDSGPAPAAPAPPPAPNPAPAPSAPPAAGSNAIADGPTFTAVAFVDNGAAANHNQGEAFWNLYATLCAQDDKAQSRTDRVQREHVTLARIAALMQILAPEPPDTRLGLVKYLSAVSHAEATRALARLAVFATEDDVRLAAVEALKVRRERDYTDVLVQALHYPWPAVARRAGDAVVKLERTDLVPQLVAMLDEADPRSPVVKEVDSKQVPVVRELVRVNHHRNCLLCHAPGNTGTVSADTLTAAVPVPDQPLPSPSQGYQTTSPDVLVRLDVTYLRQDFSAFQSVADAHPWPEMQRFDFLVRNRVLTEEEAQAWRQKLDRREPGRLSPYQKAAVTALRELTGKDTAPTAEAWRRLLDLSAKATP